MKLAFESTGNGNPLQCSCPENPRDGGAWWAGVYGVAQSWTRLKWLSSSSSHRIWWNALGSSFPAKTFYDSHVVYRQSNSKLHNHIKLQHARAARTPSDHRIRPAHSTDETVGFQRGQGTWLESHRWLMAETELEVRAAHSQPSAFHWECVYIFSFIHSFTQQMFINGLHWAGCSLEAGHVLVSRLARFLSPGAYIWQESRGKTMIK